MILKQIIQRIFKDLLANPAKAAHSQPTRMIVMEIIILKKKVDDWVLINTKTIASIRAVLIRSANTLRINSQCFIMTTVTPLPASVII